MPEIINGTRKVQRTAKDLVPVDTGALRGSIRTKMYPKQKSGVVYTTLEYAPHQEFGTSKMPAQPFMTPALNINKAGIIQSIKSYMQHQLKSPSGPAANADTGDEAGQTVIAKPRSVRRRTRNDGYGITAGGKVGKIKFIDKSTRSKASKQFKKLGL